MRSRISRSARATAAAGALLASLGPAASAEGVYSGVRIDMSAIPNGAFETKRQLEACLRLNLPAALAGRLSAGARAPVLVVRPLTVWLAAATPTSSRDRYTGGIGSYSFDSLEGEAIAGGQRVPVAVSANPDFGTQGLPEYNARLRTETLCRTFAYWVARRV